MLTTRGRMSVPTKTGRRDLRECHDEVDKSRIRVQMKVAVQFSSVVSGCVVVGVFDVRGASSLCGATQRTSIPGQVIARRPSVTSRFGSPRRTRIRLGTRRQQPAQRTCRRPCDNDGRPMRSGGWTDRATGCTGSIHRSRRRCRIGGTSAAAIIAQVRSLSARSGRVG